VATEWSTHAPGGAGKRGGCALTKRRADAAVQGWGQRPRIPALKTAGLFFSLLAIRRVKSCHNTLAAPAYPAGMRNGPFAPTPLGFPGS